MIESVFFISLGITFILILLLVYHFKQRVSSIEQKCDTMFELINNVVSEMNVQRSMMIQTNTSQSQQHLANMNMHQLMGINPPSNINISLEEEEGEDHADDEVSDSDGDDDEASDSDGENDEEDDDSDCENDEEDDDSDGENDDEDASVKRVNLTSDIPVDVIPIDECIEDQPYEDTGTNDTINIDGIPTSDLLVEKLQDVGNHHLENSETETSKNPHNHSELYKRMNLSALKALAIERGLVSDPSKMKKAELVALFESQ